MDILISSPMLSSLPMANSACQAHGTVHFVSGTWLPATPLVDSLDTQRTCSRLLSRLITVRSSPQPVIAPSSSGTLWVFVNTPSKNKDTPNGSHVYASPLLPRTQLSF